MAWPGRCEWIPVGGMPSVRLRLGFAEGVSEAGAYLAATCFWTQLPGWGVAEKVLAGNSWLPLALRRTLMS